MKKTISAILFLSLFNSGFSQSYKERLKNINEFLKTFDNGYYGYLEIKDGYLYDRFKDGNNYCRAKISDIGKAYEKETNRKVELYCIGTENCLFSTFTNQNYNSFSFSQATDFNTAELISLLDNLIAACKGNDTKNKDGNKSIDYASEKRRQESLKSKTDNNNTTSIKSNSTENYQTALKKLNDYLKTFDNGYYGYFEVKDGYIYDRFKAGKYNKFKMEDMEGAVIQEQYSRVIFKCKGENKCISTDWKENGKEDYTQFTQSGSYNYQELATLLNDFRDAYLGKNVQSNSSNSSISYSKSTSSGDYQYALKILNDYLKNFDGDRYRGLEIKDGYIYSNYSNNNYSKAKIEDIDKVVFGSENKFVKLTCKNENECIYSTITGKYHDYFNFQSFSGKSTEKLKTLLENFITALKGQTINTSSNSTSAREQKDRERKQQTNIIQNDEDEDWDALESSAVALNKSVKDAAATSGNNKNYQVPLQKLNDYLKTFNAETYKDVGVKDGKVYFGFFVYGANYKSSIDISELKNNTIITIGKSVGSSVVDEVKISCKGESKCFYSTYSNGGADHFRFFSHSVKDFTKMEQLLKDFIKALN